MSINNKTLKPAIGNKLQNNPFLTKDQSSSPLTTNSSGMKKPIITGRKVTADSTQAPWLKSQEKEIPTFSKRASIQKISQKVTSNPWKQQQSAIVPVKKNSTSPIKNSTSPLPKQQQSTPLLKSTNSSSSLPIEASASTIVKKSSSSSSLDKEKSVSRATSSASSSSSHKHSNNGNRLIEEKKDRSATEKQMSSINNHIEKKSALPTKTNNIILPSSINNTIKKNDKAFNITKSSPSLSSSSPKTNEDSLVANSSIAKLSFKKLNSTDFNSSIKQEKPTLKKEINLNINDEQKQNQLVTSTIRSLGYSVKDENEFNQFFNDIALPWQQHLESSDSLSQYYQKNKIATDYDTVFQQLIVSHAVASSLDFPTVHFDYAQNLQKEYAQDIKKNDIDMIGLRLLMETKAQRLISTMDRLSTNQEEKEQNQQTFNDRMDKIDKLIHELLNYMNKTQLKREQYLQHLAGTLAKYCSIMTTTTTTTVTTTTKTMMSKLGPSVFYQIKQDFIQLLHQHFPIIIPSIPYSLSSSTSTASSSSSSSSTLSLKQNNDSFQFSGSESTSVTSLDEDENNHNNSNNNNSEEEESENEMKLYQEKCIAAKEEIHHLFKLLNDHLKNRPSSYSIAEKPFNQDGKTKMELEMEFKKTLELEKQQYEEWMNQKKKETNEKEVILIQLKQEIDSKRTLMDELKEDLKRERQKNQDLLLEQQEQLNNVALSSKDNNNNSNDKQTNMDQLLIIISKEKERNQQLERLLEGAKVECHSKQEQIDLLTIEVLEKKQINKSLEQYKMENISKQEQIEKLTIDALEKDKLYRELNQCKIENSSKEERINDLVVQLEKEKKHSQQLEEQFIETCHQDKLRQDDIQKLESQLEQVKAQHLEQQDLYKQQQQEWEQDKHKLNQLILDLEFKQQDQVTVMNQLKEEHNEKLLKAIQQEKLSYDEERQYYQDQIKQLESQHQQLDKKHTQIFMDWEELKQQHDHVNSEYTTLQQEKEKLETISEQLKLKLGDHLAMMTEKENQLNQQQKELHHQQSAYQQLEQDHEAYKKQSKEKEDRHLMSYYHHMKKEKNEDQSLNTIDDLLKELYQERDQLHNHINAYEKEKQSSITQISALESQIKNYEERVKKLEEEMEQYTKVDYKVKYEEMIHHLEEAQRQFTQRESGYLLQSASVEAELEQVLKEYDRLLGQFTDFNSERKKYEQQIQDILAHNHQLDKQVADLQVASLAINDGASTTMALRKEFRQLMAQTKEKHQQQLEKELQSRLDLENKFRSEKQELEFLKWDKVNVSVQTNFVYI
ncbi:unnamed protein product [Cunninghamella blakesleeana]